MTDKKNEFAGIDMQRNVIERWLIGLSGIDLRNVVEGNNGVSTASTFTVGNACESCSVRFGAACAAACLPTLPPLSFVTVCSIHSVDSETRKL